MERDPQPRVIAPGTEGSVESTTIGCNCSSLMAAIYQSGWGRDGPAEWKVENGYMEVTRTGNIETKAHFRDCQLHLEWAAPAEVRGGQPRTR